MIMPLCSQPKILAFDTASQRGSVALLQGRDVLAEVRLYSLQTHSASLLRSVDFLLGGMGWTLRDLNLVAVGIGPGSFTGIRIGIATALGLAQSLAIPFAGISGLEALAYQAAFLNGGIGVALNAQRAQVYYAEYTSKGDKIRPQKKSSLIFLSELERYLEGRHLYIVGDSDVCREQASENLTKSWPRSINVDLFLAASIGRRAFSVKKKWRSGKYLVCDPLYIRPPDAIRNKSRTH
jgi:tRNA threonylcarbamoyladenosine biosynthesis protein TsaB